MFNPQKCGVSAKAFDGTLFVPARIYQDTPNPIGILHCAQDKIIHIYANPLFTSAKDASEKAIQMRNEYNETKQKETLFSEKNIIVVDDYDRDDDGSFVFLLETWLDVFKKYGVPVKEGEDIWINTYVVLDYGTKQVSVVYYVDSPEDCVEGQYDPTPEESETLLHLILDKFGKDLERDYQERSCVNVCT